MAAIADLSDLINRLTGGASGTPEQLWIHKVARRAGAAATAPVSGRLTSLWTYDGQPSAGAVPGAVAIPDNTTVGGMLQADPGGGREKWLVGASVPGVIAGTLFIYDRLLHIGGLDATQTATQAVGGTLTRYTNGVGNMILLEIYTLIGVTGTTILVNYTDQGGAAGASPLIAFGNTGFREAERMLVVPLASGDSGVQGVTNVDLTATTGTAGNFGVTVIHPIATIDVFGAGQSTARSFLDPHGVPEIQTDACLAMMWLSAGTTIPEVFGVVSMVEA